METLLRNDFTEHYGLQVATIANISTTTTANYFELKDDETLIYAIKGQGTAKYRNVNASNINVIKYEYFFNSLSPASFIQGKEKCDLIVYDNNRRYFLLNELTDTLPVYVEPFINTQGQQPGKKQKAISQLLSSLTLIMNVPSISTFINTHTFRHCCFFNKQSMSPLTITATTAFNRLSALVTGGLRMSNPAIEEFGFEFWEYSGNQVYSFLD
jgi:hypothetical protein